MSNGNEFAILDDNGTLWSSTGPDAEAEGHQLLDAVEAGDAEAYGEHLSGGWEGDLRLVQIMRRVR